VAAVAAAAVAVVELELVVEKNDILYLYFCQVYIIYSLYIVFPIIIFVYVP